MVLGFPVDRVDLEAQPHLLAQGDLVDLEVQSHPLVLQDQLDLEVPVPVLNLAYSHIVR